MMNERAATALVLWLCREEEGGGEMHRAGGGGGGE